LTTPFQQRTLLSIRGGSDDDDDSKGNEPPVAQVQEDEAKEDTTDQKKEAEDEAISSFLEQIEEHMIAQEQQQEDEENKEDISSSDVSSSLDSTDMDISNIREQATQLRNQGKEHHDKGDYQQAAQHFGNAANLIMPTLASSDELTEEFATCRLHEALCRLKAQDYEQAVTACSAVLELEEVAPAVRARAFHRRAKAQLGLGDDLKALQDARSAAFLGDRKAVALYGKLMRESSSSSLLSTGDNNDQTDDFVSSSTSLFDSLLSKSPATNEGNPSFDDNNSMDSFLSSSFLNGMGQENSAGSLAKSVLSSLSKRLEDENTQDSICRYLQGVSGPQLQQMAGMAGVPLQQGQATRIAAFCQGVTPKLIRRTLKNTKRGLYGFNLLRKTYSLFAKYRNIWILLFLLAWIKSAIVRPIPIDKRAARRAAKEAAKAAAGLAL